MKIAYIAPTEIPSKRANTIQVMKMTQAFVQTGHQAVLISPYYGSEQAKNKDAQEPSPSHRWETLADTYGLQHQFPIEWLPVRNWLRRYDYSLSSVRFARRWGADLIYTRVPQAAALTSSLGLDTILEVHDLPQGKFGTRLFHRYLRGRGARKLVIITRALARDLTKKFNVPSPTGEMDSFTIVAPDGVDLIRYNNIPDPIAARRKLKHATDIGAVSTLEKVQLEEGQFVAGYSGHLYAGRGTSLLLSLAERLPEITFLLIGGEPDEVGRLQKQVELRRLSNIILTGFISNAKLPRYQAACDVLLMPYQHRVAASSGGDISRYLSPMKLFEYMACGRAIVSSDLPVLREILNHENAILLQPDDLEAWKETLSELQTNPDLRLRLAKKARNDVQAYTWNARAECILKGL
jgi:glycosyltransferase involved in cell wall biosynthesis